MHCCEVSVLGTDSDDGFCGFYGVGIFCVEPGYECVGISVFNHRHSEIVSFIHFVVGHFEGVAFAFSFLG